MIKLVCEPKLPVVELSERLAVLMLVPGVWVILPAPEVCKKTLVVPITFCERFILPAVRRATELPLIVPKLVVPALLELISTVPVVLAEILLAVVVMNAAGV